MNSQNTSTSTFKPNLKDDLEAAKLNYKSTKQAFMIAGLKLRIAKLRLKFESNVKLTKEVNDVSSFLSDFEHGLLRFDETRIYDEIQSLIEELEAATD